MLIDFNCKLLFKVKIRPKIFVFDTEKRRDYKEFSHENRIKFGLKERQF